MSKGLKLFYTFPGAGVIAESRSSGGSDGFSAAHTQAWRPRWRSRETSHSWEAHHTDPLIVQEAGKSMNHFNLECNNADLGLQS